MASTFIAYAESALAHPTFIRFRASDGAWYNVTGSAYEAFNVTNIADYATTGTENNVTGQYVAADPTPTVAGSFLFVKQSGVNLAVSDVAGGVRWQDYAGPTASTAPTANENADALLDRADAIETGLTPRQAWRLGAASDGGVLAGALTTDVTIKGAGVATTRVEATVDAGGNRSAVILTL